MIGRIELAIVVAVLLAGCAQNTESVQPQATEQAQQGSYVTLNFNVDSLGGGREQDSADVLEEDGTSAAMAEMVTARADGMTVAGARSTRQLFVVANIYTGSTTADQAATQRGEVRADQRVDPSISIPFAVGQTASATSNLAREGATATQTLEQDLRSRLQKVNAQSDQLAGILAALRDANAEDADEAASTQPSGEGD